MHKAMRRALGVGGATAIAVAASLALAGVADAHTPVFSTGCLDNGKASLNVKLSAYQAPQNSSEHNTITVTYTAKGGAAQPVLGVTDFDSGYSPNPLTVDGTNPGEFSITITAWDDPTGKNSVAKVGADKAWDGTWTLSTVACPQTTTVPPTTKPTPPTGTTTTSPAPTTTAAAVVPVANQTPPTAKPALAYTGVSATLPLIIAGVLIVLGAAALISMRILKRRRAES